MSDTSSFQLINVGAAPNDGTGDDIRDAFIKINSNFSNIVEIGENVGNLKVAGFADIAGNINLSGYLNVIGNVNYTSSTVTTFQTFSVIGTTDSTMPTNGAMVVAGGAGVVKNLHVGGTVTAAGFYGTISTSNQPSINQLGTLVSLNVGGSTTFNGVVYANTAMNSSDVHTGAMVITGGIGLTGNLNLTGGIGAGGTLGQNGQFLVSSGMGIAWSNAPIASSLIYGATSVAATTNFTNVKVNGTNIAAFSNTSLTISGNISANFFTGNGALLSGIGSYGNANVASYLPTYSGNIASLTVTGSANIIGNIFAGGNYYGTMATSAQPNITSVGTLTSLAVSGSGNIASLTVTGSANIIGNIFANAGIASTSTTTGAIVVTGGVGVSGKISAGSLTANSSMITTSNTAIAGFDIFSVSSNTAAQLSLHAVSGLNQRNSTLRFYGTFGNNVDTGERYATSIRSGFDNTQPAWSSEYLSIYVNNTTNDGATDVNQAEIARFTNYAGLTVYKDIRNGQAVGTGNIGASGAQFNTVFAKATSAQYADLAEKYLSDQNYECGTVVMVGGTQEVTASKFGFRAIGVVSTNPAYMMNSELAGGTYIALKGRVPVKVTGKVNKGDSLIGADNGFALSASGIIAPNMVFAIALEDNDNGWIDVIEAIIL